ncbi:HdeD family acid-resistance protein [Microcoleus sp. FACHB-SPT15]|uniref:HdeD family acid-resistance protein n=1 Tax=Microcoleus sp. FACHB-SPT15 TaxID=2692830 RepID=UPI00177B25D3|nr:HdeD family acid-resistance protein [Microcoleus sp. FACHB-SPT15]MBD1808246.1 HdeD family acid-resistance protein [Microcoleus sp. FACHB-SPT15]
MTSDVSTNVQSSDIKKEIKGSLWIGALLIVLGILAIVSPAFSTIVAETWIAFILVSAGVSKLIYAFQTRNNDQGFIWKLSLSVLYIATGVMLFVYPLTGVLTLTLLLGSFLLTEGVFELILAFRLRPQQNWTWALGNGIITLVLGAMIWFQWPFNAPWLIGTLVGISVLFTGVSRVMLSLNARSALNHADTATSA